MKNLTEIGLNGEQKELLRELKRKKKELLALRVKEKMDHALLKIKGASLMDKNRLLANYHSRQAPIYRKIIVLTDKCKQTGIKEGKL